jgi:hypothetical protein
LRLTKRGSLKDIAVDFAPSQIAVLPIQPGNVGSSLNSYAKPSERC